MNADKLTVNRSSQLIVYTLSLSIKKVTEQNFLTVLCPKVWDH